jgi:hypothetical protein
MGRAPACDAEVFSRVVHRQGHTATLQDTQEALPEAADRPHACGGGFPWWQFWLQLR